MSRPTGDTPMLVETRTARLHTPDHPFRTESGGVLTEVDVAYETYGTLAPDASNAIIVCHALTGDAHAAGMHAGASKPGWWDTMIGPGKPVDTDRWFVVASNLLGGCSGTTGPASTDPATGRPYGLDFPLLSVGDFVALQRSLGHHLGITHWAAAIGGSLGGMQVLHWALHHPDDLSHAVVVAASSRLTAQNIAFSAVGRHAIMRDAEFHDGRFHELGTAPDRGLAVARMMAHITYLSDEAFGEKFGRQAQHQHLTRNFGVDFAVESYLEYQGRKFLSRFDALSYLYLSRAMDYFDAFADPDALDLLAADPVRFLVMSFDSDWRYSTKDSRRIVQHLERARVPVSFREIRSPWGHDSFLLENEQYHATVRAFLDRAWEAR